MVIVTYDENSAVPFDNGKQNGVISAWKCSWLNDTIELRLNPPGSSVVKTLGWIYLHHYGGEMKYKDYIQKYSLINSYYI